MTHGARAELERLVQDLERKHPDWPSSQIEKELELLAPVAYAAWKEATPVPRTRHRQVHRWRTGQRGAPHPPRSPLPYHFLWPVGEKQRRAIEPAYSARSTPRHASHRIFLHNCSGELLREVRVSVGGREVAFDAALEPGRLTEIHWVRNPAVREAALRVTGHERIPHDLVAEFAYRKGMKRGRLAGILTMDASDGWVSFESPDGPTKEIE